MAKRPPQRLQTKGQALMRAHAQRVISPASLANVQSENHNICGATHEPIYQHRVTKTTVMRVNVDAALIPILVHDMNTSKRNRCRGEAS
eukprot:4853167-Amphidinium_carterae.1